MTVTQRAAGAALLLALLLGNLPAMRPGPARAQSAVAAARPNVLIIITDDQRATQTLDVMPATKKAFVRGGVRFKKAFATTPLCCPSRASIMTGRYAHNHGVERNAESPKLDHGTTLQRYLDDAGYATGYVGKFLNKFPVEDPPPHFDRYSKYRSGYYDEMWNVDGRMKMVREYSTTFIQRRGRKYLRRWNDENDEQPWLLYLAPFAPHTPPMPHRRFEDARVPRVKLTPSMWENDCSDKRHPVDCQANWSRVERVARRQRRTLMSVDVMVKRIMETLRELGEKRDTLAFFISDNGYFWGEHGIIGKRNPLFGGINVPFMMRFPGKVDGGTNSYRVVANIDIAPTIYSATGIDPANPIDGHSLLDDTWSRDRILLENGEYTPNGPWPRWASTLAQDYQYTEYYDANGIVAFREYYDLIEDPWQLENLLGDDDAGNDPDPETQSRLELQLQRDRRCSGSDCP